MFDYEIKNEKIIFEKQGVYFSVPLANLTEFKEVFTQAAFAVRNGVSKKEAEAQLLLLREGYHGGDFT